MPYGNKFDGQKVTVKLRDKKEAFDETTGEKKIVLYCDDGKAYRFKEKKKDGGTTAAFTYYSENEFKSGDLLEIAYKQVDTKKDGTKLDTPNYYISFFKKLENTVVDSNYNANGTAKPGVVTHLDNEDLPF